MPKTSLINAMTVDVEDYFQVSAFEANVDRGDWDSLPPRVEANVQRILALFEAHDVNATFFILGWVAERFPAIIREIAAAGHEVASHGYSHVRATEQSPETFFEDVSRTKKILEDTSGQAVQGYRAATFSISTKNLWAWEKLEAAGYRYSSSVNPISHDLYGIPHAPRFPFRPRAGGLVEIPISTLRLGLRNFPCGGGGFFRILPYQYFRYALRRLNRKEGLAAIFYFHPWEVDPDQPRPGGLSRKSSFRHYVNLDKTVQRLTRLLQDFEWGRVDDVFLASEKLDIMPSLHSIHALGENRPVVLDYPATPITTLDS